MAASLMDKLWSGKKRGSIKSRCKDKFVADMDLEDQLLVEEYKSCRDLIARNIDIIEKTEIYAVGAAAAVAVFCLTSTNPILVKATCFIPFAITTLGLLRFLGIDRTIHKINNYLESLENSHSKIGWTKSYRAQNKYKLLKLTRYSIWAASIIISAVFAGYIFFKGPIANANPEGQSPKTQISN